jgi:hypothetical protein
MPAGGTGDRPSSPWRSNAARAAEGASIELHAHAGSRPIHYWRSKHGNEVDFVLTERGALPVAVECKWSMSDFDPSALKAFRGRYPRGGNFVVASDVTESFAKRYGDLSVEFVSLPDLIVALARKRARR